jgi:hypothetical protein
MDETSSAAAAAPREDKHYCSESGAGERRRNDGGRTTPLRPLLRAKAITGGPSGRVPTLLVRAETDHVGRRYPCFCFPWPGTRAAAPATSPKPGAGRASESEAIASGPVAGRSLCAERDSGTLSRRTRPDRHLSFDRHLQTSAPAAEWRDDTSSTVALPQTSLSLGAEDSSEPAVFAATALQDWRSVDRPAFRCRAVALRACASCCPTAR